ncbi:MAG: acyltransferase [Clostridia bacterium]|nr:acyltransferase [Clostridia bacterium]
MSETRKRIPELDGLRVLMIFIVSWYHIWQQSWLRPAIGSYSLDYLVRSGYIWVDGTVLLSSFLLFLPYAGAMRDRLPAPDTRDFYFRRARRILPGYYFIILLTLFAVAIPWGLYETPQFLVKDVATHLTFTFPFFRDTYIFTPLGAACWTLAIEVQAYLRFPWIAKGVMKKPALTLGVMCAVCFGFRAWCIWTLTDYSLVVNQLINFLDVYVIGILAAMLFLKLSGREANEKGRRRYDRQIIATVIFAVALYGLIRMLYIQSGSTVHTVDRGAAGWISRLLDMQPPASDYVVIQRNQMIYRPVYALCFTGLILSAPFTLLPLRKLLGNPVTKFLGGISMNYYLIHQTVIVHMKRIHFPESVSNTPNTVGEQPWQNQYTFYAFGISLLLAVAVTYLIEKPAARLLNRLRVRKKQTDE